MKEELKSSASSGESVDNNSLSLTKIICSGTFHFTYSGIISGQINAIPRILSGILYISPLER